jgi:3-hydroxyisobutyrate dehydrogenase-like beta-hydroxyacid dehydrogenase
MNPTVGFIGLGVIGMPMAARLVEQGLPLVVWNRTAEKTDTLVRRGATPAATPAELARRAEIVVTMVTDGPALEGITLGAEGLAVALAPGNVHCDMSTIDPDTSRRLATHYAARGVHFLHAPVLGSKRAAETGALMIFAGGPRAGFEKCAPVFAALGQKSWHWDEAPTATCVKLACNLLLAGMMEVFAESLVFAAKAGVAPGTMLEIIGGSALGSTMYKTKGEAIAQRNFTPNFYLRNMLKDLNLVLETSKQLGVELPGTRAVRTAYAAAAEQGLAEQDYSAVFRWLEQQAAACAAAK